MTSQSHPFWWPLSGSKKVSSLPAPQSFRNCTHHTRILVTWWFDPWHHFKGATSPCWRSYFFDWTTQSQIVNDLIGTCIENVDDLENMRCWQVLINLILWSPLGSNLLDSTITLHLPGKWIMLGVVEYGFTLSVVSLCIPWFRSVCLVTLPEI